MTPQDQYFSAQFGSAVGTMIGLFWEHVGILVPDGPCGLGRAVISFTKDGIIKQPVGEFARGQKFSSVKYLGNLPWQIVVQRAEWANATRPYHLTDFNCDFFVRHCHGVKLESPQAQATVALTLIGLALGGLALAAAK